MAALPVVHRARRTLSLKKAMPAPALPLPHERDEAIGGVAPEPDAVILQAKRDLDAGLVDTDMRATPGLDAQRRRRLTRPAR